MVAPMLRTAALAIALLLTACKDKKADKPADPPPTETPKTETPKTEPPKTEAPKPGSLTLGAATMIGEEGTKKNVLAIDATGKVTEDGAEVGKLTADGNLS